MQLFTACSSRYVSNLSPTESLLILINAYNSRDPRKWATSRLGASLKGDMESADFTQAARIPQRSQKHRTDHDNPWAERQNQDGSKTEPTVAHLQTTKVGVLLSKDKISRRNQSLFARRFPWSQAKGIRIRNLTAISIACPVFLLDSFLWWI